MKEVVIVEGLRTPYVKAGTLFKNLPAQELGRIVVSELLERTEIDRNLIDEVIFGNIAQPPEASNIARVIALNSGIPCHVPGVTVSRNCASGIEAIANAHLKIATGMAEVILAGGVESMSNIPILYPHEFGEVLAEAARAKTVTQKFGAFTKVRPKHLKPVIGLQVGLTDPVCDLNMGETAEVLAKEFGISREQQDIFALMSHQRAAQATDLGKLRAEIVPVFPPPKYNTVIDEDNGIRKNQTLEALAKLKPVFDRHFGTVTAGNSSQITDGAAAVLVMSAAKAKELGYEPLGYIRSYAFAGLDPARMGLGPALATPKALQLAGISFKNIQLIELNEAFAAQVIANEMVFRDAKLSQKWLGREDPIGEINRDLLNVNGGAIALGHPVGASGTRLVLTLLKEMQRRHLNLGLATLCVGGGQGAAMIVERR
ncbi:MAG: thiolase family protein [candidate division KSB1 bacterium]|nr:thiolase family protein [candidate division KSB1 bacterium]MDZ7302691.1 thiolase family protein [candidate division KSB1 bacterium]MDZ7311778.1 thiolase family protein [candidate division KSB1 bacterium]